MGSRGFGSPTGGAGRSTSTAVPTRQHSPESRRRLVRSLLGPRAALLGPRGDFSFASWGIRGVRQPGGAPSIQISIMSSSPVRPTACTGCLTNDPFEARESVGAGLGRGCGVGTMCESICRLNFP